ncbi:MAG: hypothetical protein WBZ22_27855 [Pseudolabrys sp.]
MAQLLVWRDRGVNDGVVHNPVKRPNGSSDAESFRAIRISAEMMAAWGQHQLGAAFGADMLKA